MSYPDVLIFRRLGIESNKEFLAFMHKDCHVCTSEGFSALATIKVSTNSNHVIASLYVIRSNILSPGEISLSESAMKALGVNDGDELTVSHHGPFPSFSHLRSKIFGNPLSPTQMNEIVQDIVKGNYTNIQLSAFITACAGDRMSIGEIQSLTSAMINNGGQIDWGLEMVVDKHCVGGLPGNRTTPVIVPIVAALGLSMPKTSSRAITSPAGTADTLEVLTNVNLSMEEMKVVVEKEGGCMTWGSLAGLSPADDILIRVEKALDLDSEGQLIASVLSKKVAAGATHVVIDIPVGETAKIRSMEAAEMLMTGFERISSEIGLNLKAVITDGSQPVGRGIGPALEAKDVLAVLRNEPGAPVDLKERSLLLAGELLELAGNANKGEGISIAREVLESGKAYDKFKAICLAQGRFSEPGSARYVKRINAEKAGVVTAIDNRQLALVGKLAGAPEDMTAGVLIHVKLGNEVINGQPLFEIHSESEGEMEYALNYLNRSEDIVTIQ